LLSLGEVMLRFDPGPRRIWTTREFELSEGGGEYNVARGLKRCFGLDSAIVTAFADNPVGRLIEDLIYQGGVDQSLVKWVAYDGVGRAVRNGLNFTERGFGLRAALGCSDRGHTAVSQLKPGSINWENIFGSHGVRWFHTAGIFYALSATTPEVAIEAMQSARRHGVMVSYDLNYRESLWKSYGGKPRAQEVNRRIAPYVDVMLGNEEDFSAALGYSMPGGDHNHVNPEADKFKEMIALHWIMVFEYLNKSYRPEFEVARLQLRLWRVSSPPISVTLLELGDRRWIERILALARESHRSHPAEIYISPGPLAVHVGSSPS